MYRAVTMLARKSLHGLLDCIEIVISDHAGKRPRRSHRIITQRVYYRPPQVVYHVHYHQRIMPVRRPPHAA